MKIPILITCAVFLSLCCASAQQDLTKGEGYKLIKVKSEKIDALMAVIDTKKLKPFVAGYTFDNPNGLSPLDAIFKDPNIEVVLGTGFVKSFYPLIPEGFLKINNKTINSVNHLGYPIILGIQNEKILLINKSSKETESLTDGFQIGPSIIIHGIPNKELKTNNVFASRAFFGFTTDGKMIAGLTRNDVYLRDLAVLLSAPPAGFKEIQCTEAVNLAGGGSEALVIREFPNNKVAAFGNPKVLGASMLVFVKK